MKTTLLSLLFACLALMAGVAYADDLQPADSKYIQYVGRIDFSNPKLPRFWSPGVYVGTKFRGTYCDIVLNDEVRWGHSHNWVEIAVDDLPPQRVQTTGMTNTIEAAKDLPDGVHTITVCKDTEANIGYLELVGFRCAGLVKPDRMPRRKIEFIGDSITCGADSDPSTVECGKGEWYDQHNAYMAYGPVAARELNAQWHLTSVSGIGIYHSCCGHTTTMPMVFDKMDIGDDGSGAWDFGRYQPDVVTICLGQNDGPGDPAAFHDAYAAFLHTVRNDYPKAQILCLSSPMGDDRLTAMLKSTLSGIVDEFAKAGDDRIHLFVFSGHYNAGCVSHPNVAQHQQIADELVPEIKSIMGW